jgi:hypothetical protein
MTEEVPSGHDGESDAKATTSNPSKEQSPGPSEPNKTEPYKYEDISNRAATDKPKNKWWKRYPSLSDLIYRIGERVISYGPFLVARDLVTLAIAALVALATIIGVGAAICVLWIYSEQTVAMRGQLSEMQKASRLTSDVLERPYVFFESIRLIDDTTQNNKLVFVLTFRNTGHTPAKDGIITATRRIIPGPTQEVGIFTSSLTREVEVGDTNWTIPAGGIIQVIKFQDMTPDDFKKITNNQISLMVYGHIEFSDEFGNKYPRVGEDPNLYCFNYVPYSNRLDGIPEFGRCAQLTAVPVQIQPK